MRLIDADAFKQQIAAITIANGYDPKIPNLLCELIDLQPAACDADQVAMDLQVPKKPVRPYESNYKLYYNCPNCGSSGMHDVHKHCWRCGQKLDWGEEGSK